MPPTLKGGCLQKKNLKKLIKMKTKTPRCIKCNKVMKRIYTKGSYKLKGKYRTFWNPIGYVCNHTYYPYVILDSLKKDYNITNYLIDIYDIDFRLLLEALNKIFKKY